MVLRGIRIQYWDGDHPFSTFPRVSEKLTFLAPWYAHVRVRKRVQVMLVFVRIRGLEMLIPTKKPSEEALINKCSAVFGRLAGTWP